MIFILKTKLFSHFLIYLAEKLPKNETTSTSKGHNLGNVTEGTNKNLNSCCK